MTTLTITFEDYERGRRGEGEPYRTRRTLADQVIAAHRLQHVTEITLTERDAIVWSIPKPTAIVRWGNCPRCGCMDIVRMKRRYPHPGRNHA